MQVIAVICGFPWKRCGKSSWTVHLKVRRKFRGGSEMAAFVLNGNLVYFSGEKKHMGFHPAPSTIGVFKDRLGDYIYSKQLPCGRPGYKILMKR